MGYPLGSDNIEASITAMVRASRTLVSMLAVILPAIALIGFGLYHLWSIQRDKAIEAAIQRNYQQVLAIAEKQIDGRAYDMAEEAVAKFPSADNSNSIESFLNSHPDVRMHSYGAAKANLNFDLSPHMMDDPEFREASEESPGISSLVDVEVRELIASK